MFDQLLRRPRHVTLHASSPFAEERMLYLNALNTEGRSLSTLRQVLFLLRPMTQFLPLTEKSVTTGQIESAAWAWSRTLRRSKRNKHVGRTFFVYHATRWLRLLGRLAVPQSNSQLRAFLEFGRKQRGLAPATLFRHEDSIGGFLSWLAAQNKPLDQLSPDDLTNYFRAATGSHAWKRTTIAVHVCAVRNFLRFAHLQGWCKPKLDETLDTPRIYQLERLPRGPAWSDVHRLIDSTVTDMPKDIRDHAMLMLLAVYGLRSGEVRYLKLDDIDWQQDHISIRRTKQRRFQTYPLAASVASALLRYLREVRPKCPRRELFLSLVQPYRPLSTCGFGTMVSQRLHRLGIASPCFGPHAIRHTCATHLLAEGFSLKEIGDQLGHTSTAATQIYAKTDLPQLREVGNLDLENLTTYSETSARNATPLFQRGSLDALRTVADLNLGGLL